MPSKEVARSMEPGAAERVENLRGLAGCARSVVALDRRRPRHRFENSAFLAFTGSSTLVLVGEVRLLRLLAP
jgi:hypothetical protein